MSFECVTADFYHGFQWNCVFITHVFFHCHHDTSPSTNIWANRLKHWNIWTKWRKAAQTWGKERRGEERSGRYCEKTVRAGGGHRSYEAKWSPTWRGDRNLKEQLMPDNKCCQGAPVNLCLWNMANANSCSLLHKCLIFPLRNSSMCLDLALRSTVGQLENLSLPLHVETL